MLDLEVESFVNGANSVQLWGLCGEYLGKRSARSWGSRADWRIENDDAPTDVRVPPTLDCLSRRHANSTGNNHNRRDQANCYRNASVAAAYDLGDFRPDRHEMVTCPRWVARLCERRNYRMRVVRTWGLM